MKIQIFPRKVSIESASYIENNNEVESDKGINQEEYTPKLFSEDNNSETNYEHEENEESYSEKLFENDANEDEDFEIPAFLRKQKF